MVRQMGIADVSNRSKALKKIRARISRLNKDPKEYKGKPITLVGVKRHPEVKNYYIATIKNKKRSK